MLTVMWVNVRMRVGTSPVCESVCGRGKNFSFPELTSSFFCLYSSRVRACVTQCTLVMAVILKCSTFLAVISEYSTVSTIFSLTSLLCSLRWPWDPLSSLESAPVSI